MAANPTLTARSRQRAIELAQETGSIATAAAAVGASWPTVQRWLAWAGVELAPLVVRNATPELWAALDQVRAGATSHAAAQQHGVDQRRVCRLALALGVQVHGRRRKRAGAARKTPRGRSCPGQRSVQAASA